MKQVDISAWKSPSTNITSWDFPTGHSPPTQIVTSYGMATSLVY